MTTGAAPGPSRAVVAAVVFTVAAWASAFVAIRSAGRESSPGPLSVIRIGVAALVLGVAVAIRRERLPGRAEMSGVILCGVLWFGIYNGPGRSTLGSEEPSVRRSTGVQRGRSRDGRTV